VVKSGDTVTLDYQGTSWDTGKIFDQSYGKQPATFTTDGVVEGFGAALVGQKVGTRLIVSIPPKYAYGEKGAGQQLSGQTLVFVLEIKSSAAAQ
jgi:peptidylprolyl isomerase